MTISNDTFAALSLGTDAIRAVRQSAEVTPQPPTTPAPSATETPALPPINTAEFVAMVRDWAERGGLCNDVEREMQRVLKLRFMTRSYDYVTGDYDEKDRMTLKPGQPETLDRGEVERTVTLVRARFHNRGYDVARLVRDLAAKFGLDLTVYNDTFTVTWTKTLTLAQMTNLGWNGDTDPAELRQFAQASISRPTAIEVVVNPDQLRARAATPAAS